MAALRGGPSSSGAPDGLPRFADFDLTLTDRELDDFLTFMEHQTTGEYVDAMPQLPDVAMDFPGLQLQPHSGSPTPSEGSDSAGMAGAAGNGSVSAPRRGQQPPGLAASDGSLTSAAMSSPGRDPQAAAAGSSGTNPQQQQQQLCASSPMDISSSQMVMLQLSQPMLLQQQALPVKLEPSGSPILVQVQQQQQQPQMVQFAACGSLPAVLAASAGSAAAGCGTTLAGTLGGPSAAGAAAADPAAVTLMASCPSTLDSSQAAGYSLVAPMQWHSSSAITSLAATSHQQQQQHGGQQQQGQSLSQPLPQLVFLQGPAGMPTLQQQQQQQQHLGLLQPAAAPLNQQVAAFAGLSSPTGQPGGSSSTAAAAAAMERQASGGGRASRQLQLQQQQSVAAQHSGGPRTSLSDSANGGKPQISHSTVEKQRRDRLNSLIDELSDMVPPADPKYGSDCNSVRRPKHVVLADTINLLRAMQTKLQLEEQEICTLKQAAAAVGAIAASHQVGHASVPEAADAMMQAAAAGASPEHHGAAAAAAAGGGGGGYGDACCGMMPVELPTAPESGANSTGVLVEQGIGCLYVKVNCKDRKGLLSDVVSALKAFPIVISTAAITTTKDGKVHDVFEVRIEDASVTAEDIQCAVQQALFEAERARKEGKRLRREDSGLLQA